MTATTTDTDSIIRDVERRTAFAAKLRALADVIEIHPDLRLPYEVSVASTSTDEVDRWAAALRLAGHDVTDHTSDSCREVYSTDVAFRIHKVADERMRRYYAGIKFLADHADEVAALAAASDGALSVQSS